jgi:hypothetical protein
MLLHAGLLLELGLQRLAAGTMGDVIFSAMTELT